MKTLVYLFAILGSFLAHTQVEKNKIITITEAQADDVYLAGETVTVKAKVDGDVVVAGGTVILKDSISQDLLASGGDIRIEGYINDDIRAAGGTILIDGTVNDDVIVFGGEVIVSKDGLIKGDLICFSGDIELNGSILGAVKVYGGELEINGSVGKSTELYAGEIKINGQIAGTSKMVAESIDIGQNAAFLGDIEYWTESGEVDFKNSLKENTSAFFNKSLVDKQNEFPFEFFGVAAIGIWIFYVFSAFLVIILCNWLFKALFSKAVMFLDANVYKSIGYGLIYLFGLPIVIGLAFIIIIGIPIGLFLTPIYIFSLLIGHLVLALLLAHYMNRRNGNSWGFWTISLLALSIAIPLRIVTLIPVLSFVISILIIALAYGLIGMTLLNRKGPKKIVVA